MKAQLLAATKAMSAWLAHPAELGKAPSKIECAGEFDLHDMHYYMFKYKKGLLGKWLLGVCGGYQGAELEHCGHVFSEMEAYDPDTAKEKSVEMIQMIRAHWMAEAERAEEDGVAEGDGEDQPRGGSFVAFVLLDSPGWDKKRLLKDLRSKWGIKIEADGNEPDSLVWEQDGMLATIGYMPGPVPGGEAEQNAQNNYMWPQAVETAARHQAHLLVAVLPREQDFIEAGQLLVKLGDAALMQTNASALYDAGTVFEPGFYHEAAAVMHDGELPYLNWIYFGLYNSPAGLNGYTYGLRNFGKDELEVLGTSSDPENLRDFLFSVSSYLLSEDVTLRDGETIGFTEDEKWPISRSEGVSIEGKTLKIGYMTK